MLQFFTQLLKIKDEEKSGEIRVENIKNDNLVEIKNEDNASIDTSYQSCTEEVSGVSYVGRWTKEQEDQKGGSSLEHNEKIETIDMEVSNEVDSTEYVEKDKDSSRDTTREDLHHLTEESESTENVSVDAERVNTIETSLETDIYHSENNDAVDGNITVSIKSLELENDNVIVEKLEIGSTQENSINPSMVPHFDRETFMLNIVFPEMKQFESTKSCRTLDNIVENLHSEQDKLICEKHPNKNYKIWSRTKPMELNHMILVLTTLGRWHGTNLAFQDQKPEIFRRFSEKLYNVLPKYLATENLLKVIIKNMNKMIGILERNGYHDLVQKFMRKIGSFGDILLRSAENSVIAFHVDCWIDNIRFRYQSLDASNSKPIDMCFSNFQLSMVDSPIRDLSYIIYSYSDKYTLQDFDFLLHVYHTALSETIRKFGSDADKIFSFGKLRKEWDKFGMFGVIMSLFEMFDDDEILHNEEELCSNVLVDRNEHEEYNRKVVDVFIHYGMKFL